MTPEIEAEYKAKLREFVAEKGRPVQWDERSREQYPDSPQFWVSTYGWTDFDMAWHVLPSGQHRKSTGCSWVVPEGAELVEQTYSQFTDTFSDNDQEVGINVSGCHCECGQYTDVTLRYVGSLTEVLHSLLGLPVQPKMIL